MGTLTFDELKDELRAALGGRTDLDSRLGRFLNLAQQRLARIHDFDEMEVLSKSQLVYNNVDEDRFLQMPTLREIYSITLIDGANSRKLIGKTPQWMDRLMPKPEYWARDIPVVYTIWGSYLEFWPLPKQTYDIRVRWTTWPIDLTDSTQKSQFNNKDDVILELAQSRVYYSLGKEEDGAKHEAIAKMLLGEAWSQDRARPDINIVPAPADDQVTGIGTNEPWNNPFVRST